MENETDLTEEEKLAKKDELMTNYAIKSERVHTINQLLKAYAMFEKDDEYVVSTDRLRLLTNRQDVLWKAVVILTVYIRLLRPKKA